MNNARGRPLNVSPKDKAEIVKKYFYKNAVLNPARMKAYNIFALLAQYANETGWRGRNGQLLKPKDFQDPETRALINEYAGIKSDPTKTASVPVYKPIDVINLLARPHAEIVATLIERERYFESICLKSADILASGELVEREKRELQNEIGEFERKYETLKEQLKSKDRIIRDLEKDKNELLQMLKKGVIPEQNKNYFESKPARSAPMKTLIEIGSADVSATIPTTEDNDEYDDMLIDIDAFGIYKRGDKR